MIFIYLTKCQMALPSSESMEIYYEFHSSYDRHTHRERERPIEWICWTKEIHVYENGNKNIMIIDGTQSAAASSTYAIFSFSSRRHGKLTFSLVPHTIASSHSPTNEIKKNRKNTTRTRSGPHAIECEDTTHHSDEAALKRVQTNERRK